MGPIKDYYRVNIRDRNQFFLKEIIAIFENLEDEATHAKVGVILGNAHILAVEANEFLVGLKELTRHIVIMIPKNNLSTDNLLHRKDVKTRCLMASVDHLMVSGKPQESMALIESSLKTDPDNVELQSTYARTLCNTQHSVNRARGIAIYKSLYQEYPSSIVLAESLVSQLQFGDSKDVTEAYRICDDWLKKIDPLVKKNDVNLKVYRACPTNPSRV